ncbi:MAG: SUMF1/EgtB/PvdO family nonheme iron enzyme [Roseiflexus sp.]|nr:SUMF1/EgtB/PvdO family nonheme iron enzyme [Roseiflexus sp.]MCS7289375.1 SUMF1/EgtB/PvdO family nonheme iron enzyme [Roseiflexus sp.]MDW8145102.1 SUMF1/EgtB/PvdO family nonheme iron enzyme [Roseiflexaceae bacterium]MDW8233308.1 SUMF1/EgtB/PvdO family nonheme iron enzyme [Roseiflexaceae bacterium]
MTETPTGGIIASIRANTKESGIGGTSVVGIFPHGAVACGAQDMAGNVWEWCSTPSVRYPFKGEVDAETLYTANKRVSDTYVLRGGSRNDNRAYARCAFRYANSPDGDSVFYGFRLARLFSS